MANLPFRFGRGQGLELSGADKTQRGHLRLENAVVSDRDVISKRTGALNISRTTTGSPETELPVEDLRAVWYRENELVLETNNAIYARRECGGAGDTEIGTATPAEVAQALAVLDARLLDTYSVTIPLAGSALTAGAYDRLDRQDDSFSPVEYLTPLGFDIDGLMFFDQGALKFSWSGPGVTPGEFEFPDAAGASNAGHFKAINTEGQVFFATAGADANRSSVDVYKVETFDGPRRIEVTLKYTVEDIVLGDPSVSALDGDGTNVVMITANGASSRVLVNGTDFRANLPGSLGPVTLARAVDGYVFDGRLVAGVGLRVSFGYLLVDVGSENLIYAGYAPAPGGALLFASLYDQRQPVIGDRTGVSFTALDDVVGSRVIDITSRFTRDRNGGLFDWDDVETGDLKYQYTVASSAVVFNRLVSDDVLNTEILRVTVDATAQLFEVVELSGGTHAIGYSADGLLDVWSYAAAGDYLIVKVEDGEPAFAFDITTDGVALAYGWPDFASGDHWIEYTFDLVAFSLVVIPALEAVTDPTSTMTLSVGDLGGGDVEIRGTQLYSDAASPIKGTLYSYSYNSLTALVTDAREDQVSFAALAAQHIQAGAFPRILWAAEDVLNGNREVYEMNDPLFVRVSPPTISLNGGNWTKRGPWTRGVLQITQTQDWQTTTVREAPAAAVTSPSSGDACVIQLVQRAEGPFGVILGVEALVYSTHTESGGIPSPVVLDALGRGPHVVRCSDEITAFTYVESSARVVYQFWSPGQSFTVQTTGIDAHDAVAIYDLCGGVIDSGLTYYGMIVRDSLDDTRIQIRDSDDNILAEFVDNLSAGAADAVSIYAYPDTTALLPTFMTVAIAAIVGGYQVLSHVFTVSGGVHATVWTREWQGGAVDEPVLQVTNGGDLPVSATSLGLVSIEVREQVDGEREVRTYEVSGTAETLLRTDYRSTVYGSYVERANRLMMFQSSVGINEPTSRRSGIFGVVPRTGEVAISAEFGATETELTRRERNQVSDANPYGSGKLYLGYAFESGAAPGLPTGSKFLSWDNASTPNRPAVAQGVAISAHGGHPVAYDSTAVFEQSWFELSQIRSVTAIGGALPVGEYGIAVTFDYYDAKGLLYRCSPAFEQISLVMPGAIEVICRALQRSQRENVNAVVWRTLLNGATYYRVGDSPAQVPGDITFNLTGDDSSIDQNETLDQVPGVARPGEVARITDWCAFIDDRLWSRDPARGSLTRFTIPAVEGRAPHWPIVQGVEFPASEVVTAMAGIDGRIVAWSINGAAYFGSGGPDAAGNGGYSSMLAIPSSTGATSIDATVQTPDGSVYGTSRGVYILTRGMQTMDYSDQIYAPYELDFELVRVAVWRPLNRELVLSNGPTGRTFRFNRSTQRWSEDTGRAALDMATSPRQEFTTLVADGRILVERRDTDVYTDGDIPYQFGVSTPWFHAPNKAMRVHGALNVNKVYLWGTYLNSHAITVQVYKNYSTTPEYEETILDARTAANETDGVGYLYFGTVNVGPCYAARVVVLDGVEPNATLRLSGIDVDYEATGDAPTSLPDNQSFNG